MEGAMSRRRGGFQPVKLQRPGRATVCSHSLAGRGRRLSLTAAHKHASTTRQQLESAKPSKFARWRDARAAAATIPAKGTTRGGSQGCKRPVCLYLRGISTGVR
jgi:hypothetical protein